MEAAKEAGAHELKEPAKQTRYPELVMKLANTQNGIITKQDVVELLKVTPSQAYTVIKKLQAESRLKLLCGGKYSKYKVANS